MFSVSTIQARALISGAGDLMSKLCDERVTLNDVVASDVCSQLDSALENWRTMMQPYRTAKLWIMYMDLVSILRSLLRSARSGNWTLYIQSLYQMLPYLAASGQNNYTKSLVLYLEIMDKLEHTHPSVYAKFQEGLFVLHRRDSCLSGIFSDLYIEQVLMGNIKSVGGLTRGRGFEESTSLVWLLSRPACAEVHKTMQEVTGLSNTEEKAVHKNLTPARMKHDAKDLQSLLDYLLERKPFSYCNTELQSFSSGIIGEGSVNVDNAKTIGESIVASMVGKSVSQHKFLKRNRSELWHLQYMWL